MVMASSAGAACARNAGATAVAVDAVAATATVLGGSGWRWCLEDHEGYMGELQISLRVLPRGSFGAFSIRLPTALFRVDGRTETCDTPNRPALYATSADVSLTWMA